MILGRSLYSMNGDLLLSSWTELDGEYIRRIKELGFTSIYIHEAGTEDAVPHEIISDRLRTFTQKTLHETHGAIQKAVQLHPEKVLQALKKGTEFQALLNEEKITTGVQSIVDEIFEKEVDTIESIFLKSTSGYLIDHSLDVAVYAIILGREYDFPRKVLKELGIAALLHDVGKLIYPHLIEKPVDSMPEEEREMLKEHPALSVRILERSSDRFFQARTAILYHHENQDGSGYPKGVKGVNAKPELDSIKPLEKIYPLAEILAVANTYDNFLFNPNAEPSSPSDALTMVIDSAGNILNKHIVKTWARLLNLYPPASTVIIENHREGIYNGFQGVVVRSQPGRLPQPLIILIEDDKGQRIDPIRIDFAADTTLRLKLVL